MIRSFKNRSLKLLYKFDDSSKIPPNMRNKIEDILSFLDAMDDPRGVKVPQWHLHPLKGDRKGQWAVRVSGNWRIIFRFVAGNVEEVDLVDYH